MAVGNDLSYVADGVGFGEMRNDTRLDWCWRASKERTNKRARGWGGVGRVGMYDVEAKATPAKISTSS